MTDSIIRVKARISAHNTIADVALKIEVLEELARRGRFTQASAFKLLVQDRLVIAQHCFRGLQRPVGTIGNGEHFLIYSYRLPYDVVYDHGERKQRLIEAPPGAVLMVIVEPASDVEKDELNVHGWIRWWNWVKEDGETKGAPINPPWRFGSKLWSQEVS